MFDLTPAETKAMGAKGRARVTREFSKEKMAMRLEDELNAIPTHSGVERMGTLLLFAGAAGGVLFGIGFVVVKKCGFF